MTDEEKEKYRDGLIATCKVYCHIDYDDDMEILELMFDVTDDFEPNPRPLNFISADFGIFPDIMRFTTGSPCSTIFLLTARMSSSLAASSNAFMSSFKP